MVKTLVVRVDTLKRHPKYKKYYRVSRKFKAHDEKGEYRAGDIVVIAEMRPLSKDKRWRALELVKRSAQEEGEEVETRSADAKK